MKKLMLAATLIASSSAYAAAPGGPNCGWGNLLFEGQSGTPTHVLAATTNGTSGNATFGMTSGTNGCSTSAPLTYRGKKMIDVSFIMDEFSEDAARGQGEALNAVAVMMEIAPEDRDAFADLAHSNFDKLFPSSDVTSEQVVIGLYDLMADDAQLSKYLG